MEARSWSLYQLARETFENAPTVEHEAEVIATYATWARQFCPDDAHELISILCGNLKAFRGG